MRRIRGTVATCRAADMIGSSTKGREGRASHGSGPAQFRSLPPDANPDARVGAWARHEKLCNYREPRAGQANDAAATSNTLTHVRRCHGDQDSRAGSGRTKTRKDEAQLWSESKGLLTGKSCRP
ncbi:hypothetical protein SEVIR_9G457150v4 [Setaria viridis]